MKIALPIQVNQELNSILADHLSQCKSFLVLDEKGQIIEELLNDTQASGQTDNPLKLLKNNKIDVVLCKELDNKAIEILNEFNIKIYVGNYPNIHSVKELFTLWTNEQLKEASIDDPLAYQ